MKKNNKIKNNDGIVIGVDGGGTKTEAWVAELNGKVLRKGKSGSSNLRNLGIKDSIFNVIEAIKCSGLNFKTDKILSVLIGFPAFAEEYKKSENEIKKEFLKQNKLFNIDKKNLYIVSDQEVGFKSGSSEKDGVVVICGTGSVVRGWKKDKSAKCSGWGWLFDKSGAYWVGKKALERTIESIDGRAKKSILTNLIIKNLEINNIESLNEIIYKKNHLEIISPLSLLVDESSKKQDIVAKNILKQASEELVLSVKTVIEKLKFQKKIDLVLIGGMFESGTLLKFFKKEIKKNNLNVKIIRPLKPPVYGAIKLAIEKVNEKS